jgi:hypothetical protein
VGTLPTIAPPAVADVATDWCRITDGVAREAKISPPGLDVTVGVILGRKLLPVAAEAIASGGSKSALGADWIRGTPGFADPNETEERVGDEWGLTEDVGDAGGVKESSRVGEDTCVWGAAGGATVAPNCVGKLENEKGN